MRTVHEFGQQDLSIRPLRILVSQDAVVWQFPTERIRYDHDNALRLPAGGICDVAVQAMQFVDAAGGCAGVQRARCATLLQSHS